MYGPTKTAHWATIGFVAVALLVLGGLSWATVASLRLERATRESHVREASGSELNLAMWRMDSQVLPALQREVSRRYYEYTSYYFPKSLHYTGDSEPASPVLQESPLLDTETLEPWIRLHFQYTESTDYDRWTSPQLPSAQKWPHVDALPPHDAAWRSREELLDRLARNDTANRFTEEIVAAAGVSRAPGRSIGEDLVKVVASPSSRRPDEFRRRGMQVAQLLEANRPPVLECEPVENVLNVVGQQAQHPLSADENLEPCVVSVSKMNALWLRFPDDQTPELVFVRRVQAGKEVAFQGFMVDWRELSQSLTPLVTDLYEEVKLEPILTPEDAGEPAAQMRTLPLRLVTGRLKHPAPLPAWTSNRTTLAFAWVAAIVALVAVGLGVRSLVALTSRRTEFTYAVTHELRTPLTTFQLYTDMLASGLVPEEKKPGYLRTLNEESKRLSDLVTEVLEFSRIESNAVRTNLGAYRVAELLDSIKARYASRCAAAGIALSLDANGSAERRLHTDLHIALQILGTLIDNACKYASAPAGRHGTVAAEPPCVRIAAYPGGRKLAIEVADNGPGIPPEDRHDLFQPFRRGSQAQKSKVGGVGLGLALAKRWSRLIHGNLELVDQGPRRGTCFRLTLPAE